MNRTITVLVVAALASPALAGAFSINFEEFPATNSNATPLTNEYSMTHGVTFVTTQEGSVWGGNSNGNPGLWDIEGTNGPQFLGFNGPSYLADIFVASDITGFSLDVSRSGGSEPGEIFTLMGFNNGLLVDAVIIPLLDLNTWSTVSLNDSIDQVRFFSEGSNFRPYGIDNLRWVPSPAGVSVAGMCLVAGLRRRRC